MYARKASCGPGSYLFVQGTVVPQGRGGSKSLFPEPGNRRAKAVPIVVAPFAVQRGKLPDDSGTKQIRGKRYTLDAVRGRGCRGGIGGRSSVQRRCSVGTIGGSDADMDAWEMWNLVGGLPDDVQQNF